MRGWRGDVVSCAGCRAAVVSEGEQLRLPSASAVATTRCRCCCCGHLRLPLFAVLLRLVHRRPGALHVQLDEQVDDVALLHHRAHLRADVVQRLLLRAGRGERLDLLLQRRHGQRLVLGEQRGVHALHGHARSGGHARRRVDGRGGVRRRRRLLLAARRVVLVRLRLCRMMLCRMRLCRMRLCRMRLGRVMSVRRVVCGSGRLRVGCVRQRVAALRWRQLDALVLLLLADRRDAAVCGSSGRVRVRVVHPAAAQLLRRRRGGGGDGVVRSGRLRVAVLVLVARRAAGGRGGGTGQRRDVVRAERMRGSAQLGRWSVL